MKYANKMIASMLAVLAAVSPAVPAFNELSAVNVSAVNTDYRNFSTYSYAQSVTPTLYRTCVKINWKEESLVDYYLVQVCKTDGTKVAAVKTANTETSAVIPYSSLPLSRDIYGRITDTDYEISVIAIMGNVIEENLVPYLSSSTKFTVKQDMSEYENYGAPQNIKAKCGQNNLVLSWEDPSAEGSYTTVYRVSLTNSAGKKVINIETRSNSVTINGLIYGSTYTAAIENTKYSSVTYASITVDPSEQTTASVISADTIPVIPMPSTIPEIEMPSYLNNDLLPSPKELKATSGVKMITLSWNKVKGADAYRVYIYDEAKQAYVRYKTVRSNRCTVTGLVGDKDYKFRVAGVVYDSSTKTYNPGYACKAITARSTGDSNIHYVPERKKY